MMLEWSVETVAMWRSLLHMWSLSVSNPKRCFALYCLITVKRSSQDGPGFPAITMIKEVEITFRFITFD